MWQADPMCLVQVLDDGARCRMSTLDACKRRCVSRENGVSVLLIACTKILHAEQEDDQWTASDPAHAGDWKGCRVVGGDEG